MEIVLIGAGGFVKQVIEGFERNNIKIKGIVDDVAKDSVFNYLIIGNLSSLNNMDPQIKFFCAIGDSQIRKRLFDQFPNRWVNCIHPSAIISNHIKIGIGNYIGPGVCIMPDVIISNNNIIDCLVVISHDSKVGSHNLLASHSCLLGRVTVGDVNLIGANSTILPKLSIGSNNKIGAGAVITKSVGNQQTMVGVPAKEMHK